MEISPEELEQLVSRAVDGALQRYHTEMVSTIQEAVRSALDEHIEIIVEDSSELLDGEP